MEVYSMEIGEPERKIRIEPVEEPVPGTLPVPEPIEEPLLVPEAEPAVPEVGRA
jgi:hypothetical protein